MSHRKIRFVIVSVAAFAVMLLATRALPAQTFSVIHSFSGGQDGAVPMVGLTGDHAGNFYGTTVNGGAAGGYGVIYQLARKNGGWLSTPLYVFQGGNDGAYPRARVAFGPDGSLYGTTAFGGNGGLGIIYRLKPPGTTCRSTPCAWNETVLFAFDGNSGNQPLGDLAIDATGNLYGTTSFAGYGSSGTVYQLSRGTGSWTLAVLHTFNANEGYQPWGGVSFDASGNLYGTTKYGSGNGCGGMGCGTVFQLVPSQSGWTENVLYDFQTGGYGQNPVGGLIMDQSSNLFGTTPFGQGQNGTQPVVFELSPSGSGWAFTVLHVFDGNSGPYSTLVMDAAGNLYGTANADGAYRCGTVFKLSPGSGGWTYTSLHDFTGGSDGAYPYSRVSLDASGNLYGTASAGGTGCNGAGCGVVWQITP